MSESTLRLFFALWPDEATRSAIARLAAEVAGDARGRAVAPDNVHLTLAFLGARPAASVPGLCALASSVDFAPLLLALEEIGCFRAAGVAWLGTRTVPPELVALHGGLSRALEGIGIALDARPFAPHLTLARRIRTAVRMRLARPIEWNVASFALVASELDRERARYRVLDMWHADR